LFSQVHDDAEISVIHIAWLGYSSTQFIPRTEKSVKKKNEERKGWKKIK
jgi:hypothetical protein